MRELTREQKSFIKECFKKREPTEQEKICFGKVNDLRSVEELTSGEWEKLEEMNNTEVLFQNVNVYKQFRIIVVLFSCYIALCYIYAI